MSLGAWLIIGFIAGWLSGVLLGSRAYAWAGARRGCCANIVVGIIGAMLGGAIMGLITGKPWRDFITGINLETLLVSLLGAVILISALRFISARQYPPGPPPPDSW